MARSFHFHQLKQMAEHLPNKKLTNPGCIINLLCPSDSTIHPFGTILKSQLNLKIKQRTKAGSNMAARPGLVESESWSVQPAESACAGSSNTDHFLPGSTSEQ